METNFSMGKRTKAKMDFALLAIFVWKNNGKKQTIFLIKSFMGIIKGQCPEKHEFQSTTETKVR